LVVKKKEIDVMDSKGYEDLKVYQMSYRLAMEIFGISNTFPKEERYSLTDQIRRSSRSVAVNIASAYRRRKYPKPFSSKITDANEECTETQVWLNFAHECKYLLSEIKARLFSEYDEIGRMLTTMADNPEKFLPRK
jgi:four helix bundle protein